MAAAAGGEHTKRITGTSFYGEDTVISLFHTDLSKN
jgi:hypothetical protein